MSADATRTSVTIKARFSCAAASARERMAEGGAEHFAESAINAFVDGAYDLDDLQDILPEQSAALELLPFLQQV